MELQIRNAAANNLKGFDVNIPHHKLVVITGVSGSGKSSLAYDVIANAGQNSFLDNIPGFARKFGAKKVELHAEVNHLFPVVAIKQNPGTPGVTSTLGTISDVYDMFRLLFARYGTTDLHENITRAHFSFNTKEGACANCRGIGNEEYISVDKLVADDSKSLREGALVPTQPNGYTMYSQVTVDALNEVCEAHGFTVDIPWKDLTNEQRDVVLNGSERVKIPFGKHSEASRLNWTGIKAKPREKGFYKGMLPIMEDILKRDRNKNILKFVDARICAVCEGKRLGKIARQVTWNSKTISSLSSLPLMKLLALMEREVATSKGEERIIERIRENLQELVSLGFDEHTLSTPAGQLAQGEIQRLRLINQLRSGLSNLLYVFDEPGTGLHPKFQRVLISKFQQLVEKGNSVILVEHAKAFIEQADWIIEIGPKAGRFGGEVLHNCSLDEFIMEAKMTSSPSPTQLIFLEQKPLPRASMPNEKTEREIGGVTLMPSRINLLATDVSSKAIQKLIQSIESTGEAIVQVNRKPIGKTPRSNPATYIGLADELRNEFAKLPEAKKRGLKKSHFSFNTKGGRCETCEGAGKTVVGMSYLGKIEITCETCRGKRFKEEVLVVKLNGKSIADMLNLSVDEAITVLGEFPKIRAYLNQLEKVGLGYLSLGQSSSTLSGGEAQRLKLAARLFKKESVWLLLEEPTTGLHDSDLGALIQTFDELCLAGNTILAIDYNRILLLEAHHVVEMTNSGQVLFQGIGSELNSSPRSILAKSLSKPNENRTTESIKNQSASLFGCTTHNLKNIDVSFERNAITAVTGKSGSGKSSLVNSTLYDISTSLYLSGLSAYQRSFISNSNQAELLGYSGLTPSVLLKKESGQFSEWAIVGTSLGVFEEFRFLYSRSAQQQGLIVTANDLNYTSIAGACVICGGKGTLKSSTSKTLVRDWYLSPDEGAFAWSKTLAYYGHPTSRFYALLQKAASLNGADLSQPLNEMDAHSLSVIMDGTGDEVYEVMWSFENKTRQGSELISGTWDGFKSLIDQEYFLRKDNKNIVGITELLEKNECNSCGGKRLSNKCLNIKFGSVALSDVLGLPIRELKRFVSDVQPSSIDEQLIAQFRNKILSRLNMLIKLDLGYLSLGRSMNSLSGGEAQRVRIAQVLAQPLTGLTVILDEPSSGLDQQTISALKEVISEIRVQGNSVVLVEHNAEMISFADREISLGPGTGKNGGSIVYDGLPRLNVEDVRFKKLPQLNGKDSPVLEFKSASKWSINKFDFAIYRGAANHITGVSGAGKSTLLTEVVLPSIESGKAVNCDSFNGHARFESIGVLSQTARRVKVGMSVAQHFSLLEPIARYFGKKAKSVGSELKSAHFNFRKKEGKCEKCGGSGFNETSLDILDEVVSTCEKCKGLRFSVRSEEVKINGLSVGSVLNLSLNDLLVFSKEQKWNLPWLQGVEQLGLGHLKANQDLRTVSNGELQRLKLALILQEENENQFLALDELSNGLHASDLSKILARLTMMVEKGATLLIIDHHPMVKEWANHEIPLPTPQRAY